MSFGAYSLGSDPGGSRRVILALYGNRYPRHEGTRSYVLDPTDEACDIHDDILDALRDAFLDPDPEQADTILEVVLRTYG